MARFSCRPIGTSTRHRLPQNTKINPLGITGSSTPKQCITQPDRIGSAEPKRRAQNTGLMTTARMSRIEAVVLDLPQVYDCSITIWQQHHVGLATSSSASERQTRF
jgi:hypothetical protein